MVEQHDELWLSLLVHESAHAIVASHLGFKPTTVEVHHTNGRTSYLAVLDEGYHSKAIMVAAAAAEAERQIFGREFSGALSDEESIERLAREGHLKDFHVAALRRMAAQIVEHELDNIMAMSVRLLSPGSYDVRDWSLLQ